MTARKDLVRRFYEEAYTQGDLGVIDELFSHSFSGNGRPPNSSDTPGPVLVRQSVENLRTAFPDFTPRVEDLISEGDTVVAHLDVTGTHLGPLTFRSGDDPFVIEPSGSDVSFHGLRIYQFDNGKVVAGYAWMEELDLLVTTGALEAFSEWLHRQEL